MTARIKATPSAVDAERVRRETVEECARIALAIDSGRGNEKEIAKAIRALASSGEGVDGG